MLVSASIDLWNLVGELMYEEGESKRMSRLYRGEA